MSANIEPRGRLWDCTLEDYLAERDVWSASTLGRLIEEGPTAAWETLLGNLAFPETKDRRIGSYAHEAINEFEKWRSFDARHYVKDWDGRTREGKARAAEVAAQGLIILDPREDKTLIEERAIAEEIRLAVLTDAKRRADKGKPFLAKALVAQGLVEQGVLFSCSKTGLPLRCRWDKALVQARTILEIKTSKAWREKDWARESLKYGFHRQGFIECDAFQAVYGVWPRLIHLVIHNKPPYEVALYEMTAGVLELGRAEVQGACAEVMRRLTEEDWRLPEQNDIVALSYPHWAFAERGIGA